MPGWVLLSIVIATNISPARGQIGANYFDVLNQSQVWINLEPQNLESGPNPIEVNVTATFTGRKLPTAPAFVDFRVEAYCRVFPLRVRQPVMRLLLDGSEIPLNDPDKPLQIGSACGEENNQGTGVIVARIPFAALRQMASARVVVVRALGFDTKFAPSDLRALASFIAALADGATVK